MNKTFLPTVVLIICLSIGSPAQTYNANSGGYNTGYGTVYGSFGLAQASQNMYNTLQMIQQQNMMRAAVAKGAVGTARSTTRSNAPATRTAAIPSKPAARNFGKFRPDATVDSGKTIGDALGETADEKALIRQIVNATKQAFEKDPTTLPMRNNIAGAFTFFIVANSTVYHGTPEPSDEQVKSIFDAVNQTIDEVPEFAKMSNRDKQALYNTLIGFAGIPLATLSEGTQSNNEPTVTAARQLAGHIMKTVLGVEPDKVKIEDGILKLG
jgi:hypothetical protein